MKNALTMKKMQKKKKMHLSKVPLKNLKSFSTLFRNRKHTESYFKGSI